MEIAFVKGNELGVPVILDTDAKSKCEKYRHRGIELDGVRRFGDNGVLYGFDKISGFSKKRRQCP